MHVTVPPLRRVINKIAIYASKYVNAVAFHGETRLYRMRTGSRLRFNNTQGAATAAAIITTAAGCVENIRYASPISVALANFFASRFTMSFFSSFFFYTEHVSERPAPAAVNLHRPQKWMLTNTFHFSLQKIRGKIKKKKEKKRERKVAKCLIYIFAPERKNCRDNVESSVTRKKNCRVLGAFCTMRSLYEIIFMPEVVP